MNQKEGSNEVDFNSDFNAPESVEDAINMDRPSGKNDVVNSENKPDNSINESSEDLNEFKADPKSSLIGKISKTNIPDFEKQKESIDNNNVDHYDSISQPDNLSSKAKEGWDSLKQTARERENALKKEIEYLKSKVSQPIKNEEYEALKREHIEMQERLKQVDLKSTPEYRNTIENPRNNAIKSISELLNENEVDVDIERVLSLKGKELAKAVDEITEELPSLYRHDFIEGIRSIQSINKKESELISSADILGTKLKEQNALRMNKVFEDEFLKVSNEDGLLLSPIEFSEDIEESEKKSIQDYNDSLKLVKERARQIATGNVTDQAISEASTKAAMFEHMIKHGLPRIEQEYNKIVMENAKMAKALKQLKGLKPSPNAVHQPSKNDSINYDPFGVPESLSSALEKDLQFFS